MEDKTERTPKELMDELIAADPMYLLGIGAERTRIIEAIKAMPDEIRIYKHALILELFRSVSK